MVTLYNHKNNTKRYAGVYNIRKEYFNAWKFKSLEDIAQEQANRLTHFLKYVRSNSKYYSHIIPEKNTYKVEDLKDFPTLTKSQLIEEFEKRTTISAEQGLVSYTGGTTGASLKVIFHWEDVQERKAFLDLFWEEYGYNRGDKIAWFSGKHIVPSDVTNIFWRKDLLNNIHYYSTFHITESNIKFYINNLNKIKPQFLVGFPSSVLQIVKLAREKGYRYEGKVKCFFPTAEAINSRESAEIMDFFGCDVKDQYASSEGAPFIVECPEGNLHYEMLTGIIEVIDENQGSSREGEILVTSFSTRGTPLIRYRIGDRVKLKDTRTVCPCGRSTPIVDKIFGRANDYITSAEHGKVYLGNLSNCTKGIPGIIQFQIVQDLLNEVQVQVVAGQKFDKTAESTFKKNLQSAMGPSMKININIVDSIPLESSGKFRLVKNQIDS